MAGALLAFVLGGLRWAGASVLSTLFGATSTSGFRFNVDGSISENSNGAYSLWGYWHTQKTGIGNSYQVRALSSGKSGTWSNAAAADDTWVTISAGREWNVQQASPGTKVTSATFEIRPVSGSVQRSGTGQASAEYVV